jgi:Na+/proline symporter
MNAAGCLAGMIGGFGSFVAQYLSFGTKSFGGYDPFVWALLASLVCSVVVTMLSPPPSRELTLRYFGGGAG